MPWLPDHMYVCYLASSERVCSPSTGAGDRVIKVLRELLGQVDIYLYGVSVGMQTGHQLTSLKKIMDHRRERASALQGAGAEGQHRATPTRAVAPEAPPEWQHQA